MSGEEFRHWFISGTYPNNTVDIADGEGDVLQHIQAPLAERIVAAQNSSMRRAENYHHWVRQADGKGKNQRAECFIRGMQTGAEFPDDTGDGDAMYQRFREWNRVGRHKLPPFEMPASKAVMDALARHDAQAKQRVSRLLRGPSEAEVAFVEALDRPLAAALGELHQASLRRVLGRVAGVGMVVAGLVFAPGLVVAVSAVSLLWYFFERLGED